ncbi:hypothetical protein SLS62_006457 [Diatrype stigma]|uniref:Uncharacterized protein n=1 Tax=Diatrype stigma TaxID=117547 RepID=A0AAN9UPH0_9PEZI
MSSLFEIRLLNIPARYKLSEQGVAMLQAFENFKTSRIDEAELARIIRFSPSNRAAIVDTMQKCLEAMRDKREIKTCTIIMKSCTEMLSIADESVGNVGFPFMRLPREIRERIYKFAMVEPDFGSDYKGDSLSGVFYPARKGSDCNCPPHDKDFRWQRSYTMPMPLALVSKAVSQEFLRAFFRNNPIEFACACSMYHHLSTNETFREAVTKIYFHWCGRSADRGIAELKKCPSLEKLAIQVSAATTTNLTPAQEEVRRWFGRKNWILADALGFYELIKLRGLKEVVVQHAAKKITDRRTDSEAHALRRLLQGRLLREKGEDDDDA